MNTLARTVVASLMACPVLGFAQLTPLFQFTMHFEDAVGNKDSLIIGYDPTASSQQINPQFGEVLLSAPFDSVFEVRAIHWHDSQKRTSKKIIEEMEMTVFDTCALAGHTNIVINARFPPVKISYDSTLFPTGTCRNVVLSPEWNLFLYEEWWDVCEYYCMGSSSVFVEDFVPPPPLALCWNRLYIEKEVEGQGLKELPGLFLAMFYGPGPCNDPTFLAAKDTDGAGFGTLSPNPVSEQFSIQVPSESDMQVTVRDVAGRLIVCPFTVSESAAQFDVSSLTPGLYFVMLQTGQSRQAVYKFVKV